MSGYYESEWLECSQCERYWEAISEYYYDRSWWEGRLPLLVWVRAKISIKTKMPSLSRWRDIICCSLNRHLSHFDADPVTEICRVCYTSRPKRSKTKEEVVE